MTARLRLTLLYGCLFALSGAALLGFTYWLFDRATSKLHFFPKQPPRHTISCLPDDVHCQKLAQEWIMRHALDLQALLTQSGIALAAMAAVAFLLGWLVAGRVLRPVRAITATARRISATSLHERLDLPRPDDEFSELARTLNELLGRLEASFTAQRNFVANASHELRTPLTLDRTLLQVALRNPATSVGQWRTTGQDLLESGVQQERLLEALLTLATSEAGTGRREPSDLSEAAAASLRAARQEAERRQLTLETSLNPAVVAGDPDLIERLAGNLVDNAIRHNTDGGSVQLATRLQDGKAIISVANTGPLIPASEVNRLFRPFERLAEHRAGDSTGYGLGLSIVAAIADAHDATIAAQPQPQGGLRIQVRFPCPSSDQPRINADSARPTRRVRE